MGSGISINTIDYLTYFAQLRENLLVNKGSWLNLDAFYAFYFSDVVQNLRGTVFLKKLFDSALLLYASQFGTTKLYEALLWLFRMVYVPRVSNQKTVREDSIQPHVKNTQLFDIIAYSYSHEQVIQRLKAYRYTFEGSNITNRNVKGRFIQRVEKAFDIAHRDDFVKNYDKQLCQSIQDKVNKQGKNNG